MIELLIFSLLTSLAIQAIYVCIHWEGMVLEFLEPYALDLPEWIGKPLCNCPICMASIWTLFFWTIFVQTVSLKFFWAVLIVAGMNAILGPVIEVLRLVIMDMNEKEEERMKVNGFKKEEE